MDVAHLQALMDWRQSQVLSSRATIKMPWLLTDSQLKAHVHISPISIPFSAQSSWPSGHVHNFNFCHSLNLQLKSSRSILRRRNFPNLGFIYIRQCQKLLQQRDVLASQVMMPPLPSSTVFSPNQFISTQLINLMHEMSSLGSKTAYDEIKCFFPLIIHFLYFLCQ